MAAGKYLEAQVKNYFDFRVAAVIPEVETLRNFLKSNKIDFVSQLGKRKIRKCPMRKKVQAQLTMNDIITLEYCIFIR